MENSSVPVAGTGGDPNAGDGGVLHKAEVVDHHAENAASADCVPRCTHEKETPELSTIEPRYNFRNLRMFMNLGC